MKYLLSRAAIAVTGVSLLAFQVKTGRDLRDLENAVKRLRSELSRDVDRQKSTFNSPRNNLEQILKSMGGQEAAGAREGLQHLDQLTHDIHRTYDDRLSRTIGNLKGSANHGSARKVKALVEQTNGLTEFVEKDSFPIDVWWHVHWQGYMTQSGQERQRSLESANKLEADWRKTQEEITHRTELLLDEIEQVFEK